MFGPKTKPPVQARFFESTFMGWRDAYYTPFYEYYI